MVGLALSGGAARGLAHIGVIQELEARGISVQVVSGTSMGALIGGLYAAGLSADSLEGVARAFNEADVFADQVPRSFLSAEQRIFDERFLLTLPIRDGGVRLPGGALEGSTVTRALEKATWRTQAIRTFDDLPRPFAAVATDLRSGQAVVLRRGGLAEAIRASIAIPGLFQPVERDGRLLVDGALVRNLPAGDARRLGAELLICSDVSTPPENRDYDSVVDILSTAISVESQRHINEQYDLCDVVLRPVDEDLTAADFQALERWVSLGRTAVQESMGDIVAAIRDLRTDGTVARFTRRRQGAVAPPVPDSVLLGDIRLVGLEGVPARDPAWRALGLRPGTWVDADAVDRALTGLQATDLYDRISYSLTPTADPAPARPWTLVIELRPVQRDRLGLGVRFDNTYQASALLSAAFLNRGGYGSSTRLDARLGEELQLQLSHNRGRGVTSTVGLGFSVGFTRAPLALRARDLEVQEVRSDQLHGAVQLAVTRRRGGLLAVELRGERSLEETVAGSGVTTRDRGFASLRLVGFRDTWNRAAFPTSGYLVHGRAEWADRDLLGGTTFRQLLGEVRAILPLPGPVVGRLELFAGAADGPDLPLNRHFFLGGVNTSRVLGASHPRLYGVEAQYRWGQVAQAARFALQWEVAPDWFVTGTANAGQVRADWGLDLGDWVGGWGLGVGSLTLLGPAELVLVGQDSWNDLQLALNLGRAF